MINDYARRRMDRRGRMDYARRGGRDRRDYHGGGEYRGNMEYRGDYDMVDDYDYDMDDYDMDGRQGVKGTGRYGRGGSMYRGDRARSRRDYYSDGYDYADEPMRLTKREMSDWKRSMQNADGSLGEHFSGEQIKSMAEKLGVRYNGYDEKELCMTVNMIYSDFCEALRSIIPPEKEIMAYVKMGKAFLEDEDAPEGGEKLALYFRCIVDSDE